MQGNEAAFYKYTGTPADRKAAQFRAFIRMPSGASAAPSFALPDTNGEEGIEMINVDKLLPTGIYSIDGKRLNELQKGMNVIVLDDGTAKKVFVK